MPQMSNLNWVMLLFFFILIYMMFMVKIYYFYMSYNFFSNKIVKEFKFDSKFYFNWY